MMSNLRDALNKFRSGVEALMRGDDPAGETTWSAPSMQPPAFIVPTGAGVIDYIVDVGPDWIEVNNASLFNTLARIEVHRPLGAYVDSFLVVSVVLKSNRLYFHSVGKLEWQRGDLLMVSGPDEERERIMSLADYDSAEPVVHVDI